MAKTGFGYFRYGYSCPNMPLQKFEVGEIILTGSVADPNPDLDPPDPHVFGLSISQRYGSGSFYHQAKKVRKTLIPTAL